MLAAAAAGQVGAGHLSAGVKDPAQLEEVLRAVLTAVSGAHLDPGPPPVDMELPQVAVVHAQEGGRLPGRESPHRLLRVGREQALALRVKLRRKELCVPVDGHGQVRVFNLLVHAPLSRRSGLFVVTVPAVYPAFSVTIARVADSRKGFLYVACGPGAGTRGPILAAQAGKYPGDVALHAGNPRERHARYVFKE